MTIADLTSLKSADWMQLSPDGSELLYTIQGKINLLAVRRNAAPQELCKGRLPMWSPEGSKFAFYADTADGLQLLIFNVNAGRSRQITHVMRGIDPDPNSIMLGYVLNPLRYSWSPDGKWIVFASQVFGQVGGHRSPSFARVPQPHTNGEPLILTRETPPGWTLSNICDRLFGVHYWAFWEKDHIQSVGGVSQLFIVNTSTGAINQLTTGALGFFNPEWSPDGTKIVAVSFEGRDTEGALDGGPSNIYSIEVNTRLITGLTRDEMSKWMPTWSPNGSYIAFQGSSGFGLRKLFVIPAAGGTMIDLTSEIERSVTEFQWSADSESVVAAYHDGVSMPVAGIDIHTGTATTISDGMAGRRSSLTAARNGTVAWQQSDPSSPATIRVLPEADAKSWLLADLNPQVRNWDLGAQDVVHWKNSRGEELEGVLMKPPDYSPAKHYPVVVDVYPFQGDSFKGDTMMGNQAWASLGYAVFWPNPRAPHVWENPFKSLRYNQAAKGPTGWDVTVDDVLSGVDYLVQHGIADPDKMCLYGFSNGGGVANYLVTRTNRFKCAISIGGALADWVRPSLLDTDSWVPPLNGGVTIWDNPNAYIQLSAVFGLKNVRTPMLLADGDDDKGFLLNTIEMFNGLRHFNQDVILLRYPGQEHGFSGRAMEDFWKRETAFVASHLK